MEKIIKKIYTQEELDSNYDGDTLGIDNELRAEFKDSNPDAKIIRTYGVTSDNIDGTFTYSMTFEYEL
jgi:hypothetical protein